MKQSSFNLITKKETFYVNNTDNVIGVIFFKSNNFSFPEYDWGDFVVAILAWLAKIISDLQSLHSRHVEVFFMEGCFKVEFQLNEGQFCRINFIEGDKLAGDKEIIHKTITVPLGEVIDEVTKACEMVIRMRESKELEFENDYEELLEAYHSLTRTSNP